MFSNLSVCILKIKCVAVFFLGNVCSKTTGNSCHFYNFENEATTCQTLLLHAHDRCLFLACFLIVNLCTTIKKSIIMT